MKTKIKNRGKDEIEEGKGSQEVEVWAIKKERFGEAVVGWGREREEVTSMELWERREEGCWSSDRKVKKGKNIGWNTLTTLEGHG